MGYKDGIEKHLAGRRREREIKDLSSIMVNRFMLGKKKKKKKKKKGKEKGKV